jgi:hypothetical protein
MNEDLIKDLGENYHYAKTIFQNKVEIKKLKAIQKVSSIIEKAIIAIILGFIGLIVFLLLLVMGISLLTVYLDSLPYALVIFVGLFSLLGLCLYLFRGALISNPIQTKLYINIFGKNEDE